MKVWKLFPILAFSYIEQDPFALEKAPVKTTEKYP